MALMNYTTASDEWSAVCKQIRDTVAEQWDADILIASDATRVHKCAALIKFHHLVRPSWVPNGKLPRMQHPANYVQLSC